jgi:hypothetical protein
LLGGCVDAVLPFLRQGPGSERIKERIRRIKERIRRIKGRIRRIKGRIRRIKGTGAYTG